jgi:hypothetical protein
MGKWQMANWANGKWQMANGQIANGKYDIFILVAAEGTGTILRHCKQESKPSGLTNVNRSPNLQV